MVDCCCSHGKLLSRHQIPASDAFNGSRAEGNKFNMLEKGPDPAGKVGPNSSFLNIIFQVLQLLIVMWGVMLLSHSHACEQATANKAQRIYLAFRSVTVNDTLNRLSCLSLFTQQTNKWGLFWRLYLNSGPTLHTPPSNSPAHPSLHPQLRSNFPSYYRPESIKARSFLNDVLTSSLSRCRGSYIMTRAENNVPLNFMGCF